MLDSVALQHFPLRKIKEDQLFQAKRQSHPLIVADFCAYVWKKALMKDARYKRFLLPFVEQIIHLDDPVAARSA
jgi:hypothetical protein